MRLTKFFKLRRAISNLDFNFIANKIAELEDCLSKRGKELEPANTAITHEGIFYINPESGMATKVVLYEAEQRMSVPKPPRKKYVVEGYDDPSFINKLYKYHLIRCNVLSEMEKNGWRDGYRIVQKFEHEFYYKIVKKRGHDATEDDIYQEIEKQNLELCQNCFLKINSLLEGVQEVQREDFPLNYFFNVDFFGSWCRYGEYISDENTLAGMYPKDWEEICRIRKEQVQYHCETCQMDYSSPEARSFLFVQPIDHIKKKVPYVKLQCTCISCLSDSAEEPVFENKFV